MLGTPLRPLAPAGISASASQGGQRVLRENRKPVGIEIAVGVFQGFPDLFPQVGHGTDGLSVPVGQADDPVHQRQRPDLSDQGQTGWRLLGYDPMSSS